MQIRDVMSPGLKAIEADGTIAQAAAQMKSHNVGVLPVTSGGKVVGVITDRDLVVRALAAGLDPKAGRVRQAMTRDPVSCRIIDDVEVAAALMRQKKVRRLLVSDEAGQPVGVVSLGDLAANLRSAPRACEVLSEVCGDLQDRRSRR